MVGPHNSEYNFRSKWWSLSETGPNWNLQTSKTSPGSAGGPLLWTVAFQLQISYIQVGR